MFLDELCWCAGFLWHFGKHKLLSSQWRFFSWKVASHQSPRRKRYEIPWNDAHTLHISLHIGVILFLPFTSVTLFYYHHCCPTLGQNDPSTQWQYATNILFTNWQIIVLSQEVSHTSDIDWMEIYTGLASDDSNMCYWFSRLNGNGWATCVELPALCFHYTVLSSRIWKDWSPEQKAILVAEIGRSSPFHVQSQFHVGLLQLLPAHW